MLYTRLWKGQNMELVKMWKMERIIAIKSQDVDTFKAFYNKWKARGFYELELPNDMVLEVSLRKMLYNLKGASPQEKATAKKWLTEHGCSTDM